MRVVTAADLDRALAYPALVDALQASLSSDIVSPERTHHAIARPGQDAVLLLMPAWTGPSAGKAYLGTKIVSVFFDNNTRNLPGVLGSYLLMDGESGLPLAVLDGNRLTAWRTAAVSAIAARYLAPADSRHMLMVGAGTLAPFLIRAHRSVRPLEDIAIWARRPEAAEALAARMVEEGIPARATTDLEGEARTADVISCATNATEALIHGRWLKRKAHLDLIGSFTLTMRETDAEALNRAHVIVDTEAAITEGGDIAVAIAEGSYDASRVAGTLADLCAGKASPLSEHGEITLFKSVGFSAADLVAARTAWENLPQAD